MMCNINCFFLKKAKGFIRAFAIVVLLGVLLISSGCSTTQKLSDDKYEQKLSILSFNVFQEGTRFPNGFEYIADNIAHIQPDIVSFAEVRNYNNTDFIARMIEALQQRGLTYYGKKGLSTGVISRYPIEEQFFLCPWKSESDDGSATRVKIRIKGQEIVLYALHLDWRYCSYYLPRGFHSSQWIPIDRKVTDPEELLEDSRKSNRDEILRKVIEDASLQKKKGALIFIAGDFNEPSHLDWQHDTRDLYAHHGVVVDWECSALLKEQGYMDSFRQIYPDSVTFPGFTYPAFDKPIDLTHFEWDPAKGSDNERIDFIYYYPDPSLILESVSIVGPVSETLNNGAPLVPAERDVDFPLFIAPHNGWGSDHKAVFSTFRLNLSQMSRQ